MPKSEQAKQRKRDAARAKKLAAQEQGTDGAAQQRETAGAAERERGNYRYVDELDAAIATAVARELEKGGDEPELTLDERFVQVGLEERTAITPEKLHGPRCGHHRGQRGGWSNC